MCIHIYDMYIYIYTLHTECISHLSRFIMNPFWKKSMENSSKQHLTRCSSVNVLHNWRLDSELPFLSDDPGLISAPKKCTENI